MAIKEQNGKPPISAAPSGIVAPSASPVQGRAALPPQSQLKVPVTGKLKAEEPENRAFSIEKETQQAIDLKRSIQFSLINNINDVTLMPVMPVEEWIKKHPSELGTDFKKSDPIDVAYAEFRNKNSTDRTVTAVFESENHASYIVSPRLPSQAGRDRTIPSAVIDDGFKVPAFKLSKEQARTELARDIRTVSEMYAADAGMSAKDFAKVMGGIATIESRFGVLRSIPSGATKYASSAGGAFHYLNGTIAGEVRQSMSDPRIASRVAALGVSVNNGVSTSEAWTLKDDNILAGSILAKRIVETIRKNPELKDDVAALTTRVYQAHNLGDAGARTLAQGGVSALDDKSKANNPLFFKNAQSDADVNSRYTKFVTGAIASANPLIETAFTTLPETTVVASARQNKPSGLPSREPA